MSKQPDHYAALGVPRDATLKEIKRAYREAAQKLHPDVNQEPGETELFLDIQQAFEVLSNKSRRAKYDATLAPVDEPEPAVLHEVSFSRPNLVKLQEPQVIYMLLEVFPRQKPGKLDMPPLNVALVLDRSTSMQGEKLDMVKAAATQLIRGLGSEDILSVVGFSDRPEVIVPATAQGDRKQMEELVHQMQPSGSTEIFKGLEAGLQQVETGLVAGRINHIILLTDGHTYGDEQACLGLAERAAGMQVGISGMGIGSQWNDIFLDALAGRTGGSSQYISKADDIGRLLTAKFKTLERILASEVLLELAPQKGVQINYAFRIKPEPGPIENGNAMSLGPVLQDESLGVLFEYVIAPAALKGKSVTLLHGTLRISLAGQKHATQTIRLKLAREVQEQATSDPAPNKILEALSSLTLYRLQERARRESDEGRYEEASLSLKGMASNLLAQGEHELARTALLEAENLERQHEWSSEGGKVIKYGTRSLLFSNERGT